MLATPILFLVFNRLDTTKRVFLRIREARPQRLYIAADGPRLSRMGEKDVCAEVRDFVLRSIDWPCEVKTLFREENLGCGKAVSGAISWLFENEERGIVLEDDCVPSRDFFIFCDEMLNHFCDDERIMLISGMNRQGTWKKAEASYFFSNLGGIWGWATWKRAWSLNKFSIPVLDEHIKWKLKDLLGENLAEIRIKQFQSVQSGSLDTWDYQWAYYRHMNSGLAVVPVCNLVMNIGFDIEATHTVGGRSENLVPLQLPIVHETCIVPDKEYDGLFFTSAPDKSFIKRVICKLWDVFIGARK